MSNTPLPRLRIGTLLPRGPHRLSPEMNDPHSLPRTWTSLHLQAREFCQRQNSFESQMSNELHHRDEQGNLGQIALPLKFLLWYGSPFGKGIHLSWRKLCRGQVGDSSVRLWFLPLLTLRSWSSRPCLCPALRVVGVQPPEPGHTAGKGKTLPLSLTPGWLLLK